MAQQPRTPSKPEKNPKKKNETVHLSPDELRKIAGGAKGNPPPPPQPDTQQRKH
jgi:hypothetical protein